MVCLVLIIFLKISELALKSRTLKINLFAALVNPLAQKKCKATMREWLKENKEVINEMNKASEKQGLFSGYYRVS